MTTTTPPLAPGRRRLVALRLRHGFLMVLAISLAVIALVSVAGHVVQYCQQRAITAFFGEPVAVRLTADLGGGSADPITAWTLNADGQISVLVVQGTNLDRISSLPGPYIPGRNGRYVVPWLRAIDADGDGDGDLVVNIAGELFVYLQGSDGTLHYATESEQALLRPAAELWP